MLRPGEELRLAFTLLADAAAGEFAYRDVVRFVWKRWAEPGFTSSLSPQVLPFDEYAREGFASTLERYGLWREFTIDGTRTGGTCARIVRATLDAGSAPLPHDTTLKIAGSYLRTPTMSLRDKARLAASAFRGILPHVFYNLFLNNLRTAFGMGWYARRWNDAALAEKARMMRELALSAPAPHGILPSVFTADPRRPRWVPGTGVWRYTSAYHTANAAWTGCWMLHHFRHLGADERLLDRCRSLGDFLVRAQLPSGAIPTFVRVRRDGSIRPVPPLVECASSAGPGMFLAMLHESSEEPRYLEAAKRAADFIIDRVFPRNAWHDVGAVLLLLGKAARLARRPDRHPSPVHVPARLDRRADAPALPRDPKRSVPRPRQGRARPAAPVPAGVGRAVPRLRHHRRLRRR